MLRHRVHVSMYSGERCNRRLTEGVISLSTQTVTSWTFCGANEVRKILYLEIGRR